MVHAWLFLHPQCSDPLCSRIISSTGGWRRSFMPPSSIVCVPSRLNPHPQTVGFHGSPCTGTSVATRARRRPSSGFPFFASGPHMCWNNGLSAYQNSLHRLNVVVDVSPLWASSLFSFESSFVNPQTQGGWIFCSANSSIGSSSFGCGTLSRAVNRDSPVRTV